MPLQIRRGSTDERLTITPLRGELVFDTTNSAVYIGDGTTPGGLPVTNFSVADARNTTAQMFLGESLADNSVHTGVTFALIGGRLAATVQANLEAYDGVISASGYKGNFYGDDSTVIINGSTGTVQGKFRGEVIGSVFSDNSTMLVDGTNGVIHAEVVQGTFTGNVVGNVTGNVTGSITDIAANVLPLLSEQYDLGSFSKKFNRLYLTDSATSLYIGNAVVGTNGGTGIALPAGSTVGGVAIGTGGIVPGNNYYISVKDSADVTMIDADNNIVTATKLIGNVYASNGTTVLVDSQTGNVPAALEVTNASQPNITSVGTLSSLTSTGVISTTGSFESYTESASNKLAAFTNHASATTSSPINVRKSRGTQASPTTVLAGDTVSTMLFQGYDGAAYQAVASIVSRATGTIGSGIVPGQLELSTADAAGTLTTRITISNTGAVTLTGTLNISGNMSVATNTSGIVMSSVNQYHATADANNFNFVRGRGTTAAPVRVQTNDEIVDISFRAYVAATDTPSTGAVVELGGITPIVTGAVGASGAATDLQFLLNDGSSTAVKLQLSSDGVLDFKSTALSAGVGSGLVDTGAVATWMKVKLNGVEYALPLYAIQP